MWDFPSTLSLCSMQISFSCELSQGGGWRKAFLLFMCSGQNPGGLCTGIPWSCFQPPQPLLCSRCTGVGEIYCPRSFSSSLWGHIPVLSTSKSQFWSYRGALLLQSLQSTRAAAPGESEQSSRSHTGSVLTAQPAAPPRAWGPSAPATPERWPPVLTCPSCTDPWGFGSTHLYFGVP